MTQKHSYAAPEAELLVVKFEECILSPTGTTDDSTIESGTVNNQSNPQNSIWGWYE